VNPFQKHLAKAKKLDLSRELNSFLAQIQDTILDLNKHQLLSGKDAKNQALFSKTHQRGVYSAKTEELSGGRKIAGTHYTLKDTGNFFSGFYLRVDERGLFFGSIDEKSDFLVADYGDIFGLTPDNLSTLTHKTIKPYLISYVRRVLL